jgi:DNA-directed RNA polymerase subunit RPC12/RpoP
LADAPEDLKKEAWGSVLKYHFDPQALDREAKAMHGLDFLIVHDADLVIALPSDEEGSGVTGQGMRVSLGTGIVTWCIDARGEKIDADKYRLKEAEEEESGQKEYRCDDCTWHRIVSFDDDPTTSEGACPECGSFAYTIFEIA